MTLTILLKDVLEEPLLHSVYVLGFPSVQAIIQEGSNPDTENWPQYKLKTQLGQTPRALTWEHFTAADDLGVTERRSTNIEHMDPTHHIGKKNKMLKHFHEEQTGKWLNSAPISPLYISIVSMKEWSCLHHAITTSHPYFSQPSEKLRISFHNQIFLNIFHPPTCHFLIIPAKLSLKILSLYSRIFLLFFVSCIWGLLSSCVFCQILKK